MKYTLFFTLKVLNPLPHSQFSQLKLKLWLARQINFKRDNAPLALILMIRLASNINELNALSMCQGLE
jgi:hypothetical protein